MLTYSLSFNGVISIPPLLKIASAKIVEFLWNKTAFIPENPDRISPPSDFKCFDNALTEHREKILCVCSAFTEENNLPSIFKSVFKESVYSLCRASMQVFEWKEIYDPSDETGFLEDILSDARHYFTVDGEFDDLAWSKRVVIDPFYDITSRFYLACYYCFEDETSILWSKLKDSFLPYNGDLNDIPNQTDPLVAIRIFQLENQLEALAQDHQFADFGVYEMGLEEAVRNGYANAIRYFLKKIEPENIFEVLKFNFCCGNYEKTAVLLFSQFSKEQKQNLSCWSFEGSYKLFFTALLSPYTELERSEIIEIVYKLPSLVYGWLFDDIVTDKYKNSLSFHREEVLRVLWAHLSTDERDQYLRFYASMVRILEEENLLDFADCVLKNSLPEPK